VTGFGRRVVGADATGQRACGHYTRSRKNADHNNPACKETDSPQKTHLPYPDLKHPADRQSSMPAK
jgi:hypothetical protein